MLDHNPRRRIFSQERDRKLGATGSLARTLFLLKFESVFGHRFMNLKVAYLRVALNIRTVYRISVDMLILGDELQVIVDSQIIYLYYIEQKQKIIRFRSSRIVKFLVQL